MCCCCWLLQAKGEEVKSAEVPSVEPLDGVLLASDAVHYADQTVLVLGATPEVCLCVLSIVHNNTLLFLLLLHALFIEIFDF